jgi:proteasome lid subunit RPN8/RPN11
VSHDQGVRLEPDATLAVTIDGAAMDAIRRHGAATYPDECCGALIGVGDVIREAFPMDNTTASGAARRFRIGPDAYRAAEARAAALGASLLGFYHSHPNEPARPSAYDLEHAWPNFIYVIISVGKGVPGDTTAWRLQDNRSEFIRMAFGVRS